MVLFCFVLFSYGRSQEIILAQHFSLTHNRISGLSSLKEVANDKLNSYRAVLTIDDPEKQSF